MSEAVSIKLKAGALIVGACSLLPSVAACDPLPHPPITPSSTPSSASMTANDVIEARIIMPEGDWRIDEVEVDGAKLLSRDGDSTLQLRMKVSELKRGETQKDGGDEPIRIHVTYIDRKSGAREPAIFSLKVPANAEDGTSIPVETRW